MQIFVSKDQLGIMAREFPRAERLSEPYRKSKAELYDPVTREYICRYRCEQNPCEWRSISLRKTTDHESKSLGARRKGQIHNECHPYPPAYANIPGLA